MKRDMATLEATIATIDDTLAVVSYPYIKTIFSTLPIGYYLGRNINVELSPTEDGSFFTPFNDKIVISYPTIAKTILGAGISDKDNVESIIRGLLYHEISHVIYTPNTLFGDCNETHRDIINIFEDERIETICFDRYLNVNFKRNIILVNHGIPEAKSALSAFYKLVRFRIGDEAWLQRLNDLIKEYADINAGSYTSIYASRVKEYRRAIINFYYDFTESLPKEEEENNSSNKKSKSSSSSSSSRQSSSSSASSEASSSSSSSTSHNSKSSSSSSSTSSSSTSSSSTTDDSSTNNGSSTGSDSDDSAESSDNTSSSNPKEDKNSSTESNDDSTNTDESNDNSSSNDESSTKSESEDSKSNKDESNKDESNNGKSNEDNEDNSDEDELTDEKIDKLVEDICKQVSKNAPVSETQFKKDVAKLINVYFDLNLNSTLTTIVNNKLKQNKQNGSAINSYSGRLHPRSVGTRDDYRWWTQQNRTGHIKQYSKVHFNLFIDNSGSFRYNDTRMNQFIQTLDRIEKANPDFTFDVITINTLVVEWPNHNREFNSNGGNKLLNDIAPIIRNHQKTACNNYNIVLFDGDAHTDDKYYHDEDRDDPFKHFDTSNTFIITDEQNKRYIEAVSMKNAVVRYCDNYCEMFVNTVCDLLERAI